MNDNDDVILTPEQNERLHMAIQRVRANFLRFPVLCTNVTCRRARKCSADPDFCMGQLAPDVPDDVRNAADEMLFGTFAGLPFDEVAAKAPRQLSAYCGWLEKVKNQAADAGRSGTTAKETPANSQRRELH